MSMLRILFIIIFIFSPVKTFALIEVDITRGNLNPLPIAVSPLSIDENSRQSFEKVLKKKKYRVINFICFRKKFKSFRTFQSVE